MKKKLTGEEWCKFFEVSPSDILDPDGWRNDKKYKTDGFKMKKITEKEFYHRMGVSTCRFGEKMSIMMRAFDKKYST
jgi:hypothetical protein